MKNDDKTNGSKRDQKKKVAMKQLIQSKGDLIRSAKDLYKSLTKIALYKKEEVTEQLLNKIKEAIEKVEKKK